MLNKFKTNDVVSYLPKGRHNGIVLYTLCGTCVHCQSKQFDLCDSLEKNKVIVSWETNDPLKPYNKCRYNCSDLEWTNIASPQTGPRKTINGIKPFRVFVVDLKKLGSITPDIVSIDTEEPESIVEPPPASTSTPQLVYEDDEYYEWAHSFKK